MKEDEDESSNWKQQQLVLPSPDELIPLTQSLITPHLLLAFDLQTPPFVSTNPHLKNPPLQSHPDSTTDLDSSELGGAGGDDSARTLKRPRLVWTPQLHKRFVDAVAHLGIKNAVPKTIMQLMSVDGLTRENVASHLQKYRLYLKRMQGGHSSSSATLDSATHHLFATSPVPSHFLHPIRPNSDHFLPFLPAHSHYNNNNNTQLGHFGSPPLNGQFEIPYLPRQTNQHQQQLHRLGTPVHNLVSSSYVEDLESATIANGRKALTLFPTGDN